MKRRRPLSSYGTRDAVLFLRALVWCAVMRVAVYLVPSPKLLSWVKQRVRDTLATKPQQVIPASRVGWAIRAAGRRVPRSTCLVEALAAQILLANFGHSSILRIGVARDAANAFVAHAWVDVDGVTLVGERRDVQYIPFPDAERMLG